MSYKKLAAVCVFAIAAPIVADADSFTYDFTGVVESTSGSAFSGIASGTPVSGTYTINYANATPVDTSGTVGSTTATWIAGTYGGSGFGTPAPTLSQYVFSSALTAGALTYATSGASRDYDNNSSVEGSVSSTQDFLSGVEYSHVDSFSYIESYFYLINETEPTPVPTWDSAGNPLYSNSSDSFGGIAFETNSGTSTLEYTITSFQQAVVPVPAAAWLLLSGLGRLGFSGRRQLAGAIVNPERNTRGLE